ncbi:hypothetical protein [Pontibacter ruber]|uniref:Outer membrane protein beta-barrel domain-containing protein n=1 Tax=Pontibacter ruber TaxID=1343895 RepID=A0ABW5CRB4_9BACT|nr:hypothetical protein [Pontibacter ruber]
MRAKVKQGSIMIGGSLNASAYKVEDEFTTNTRQEANRIMANLRAKNGYFVLHDFAVGLDVTMNHESVDVTTDEDDKARRLTYLLAGPFVRYFLDNGVFGELSVNMGLLNLSSGSKSNLVEGAIGIGYAHFINEKFSIEPLLTFRYFNQKDGDRRYTTYGPMLGVGIQAYLLRKKAHVIKKTL